MKNIGFGLISISLTLLLSLNAFAADPTEIYCTIRDGGTSLNCQWVTENEKYRPMKPEDISTFIDQAQVAAYLTVKSKKGMERVFMIDPKSPSYKKLQEMKASSSISEISKLKTDLFADIEKKVIKLSDNMDAASIAADLVKYDPSIGYDKFKMEARTANIEIEGFKKNRDKVCTSTPAFEQLSRANSSLQSTLSNILLGFQTSDSCMSDYKVFKDKDGSVDLRQLDGVREHFVEKCRVKK